MSVVPFRWQGTTRSSQVRELVLARSHEWTREWSAAPSAVNVAAGLSDVLESRASDRWYRIEAATGRLHLRAAANTTEQLGCRLAGVVSPDAHALARGVGGRALTDLATTLFGADGVVAPMENRPADDALLARNGAVALRWSMDGVTIELFFDAKWCDKVLPRQSTPEGRLVARSEAILPAQMMLHAEIDLGSTALEETLTLRPGEIIKTNVPLDGAISVKSPAGETLFTGTLAAADGHRAVRLTRKTRC